MDRYLRDVETMVVVTNVHTISGKHTLRDARKWRERTAWTIIVYHVSRVHSRWCVTCKRAALSRPKLTGNCNSNPFENRRYTRTVVGVKSRGCWTVQGFEVFRERHYPAASLRNVSMKRENYRCVVAIAIKVHRYLRKVMEIALTWRKLSSSSFKQFNSRHNNYYIQKL